MAPSTIATSTRPSASRRAVSIESVRRVRSPSFITSRSTTTEIEWRICLSRSIGSSSRRSSPSTLTRVKPSAAQLLEEVPVLALARPHDRRVDREPRPLRERQHLLDDLLGGLAGDLAPARRAVRPADPRVEEAQIVVDLGDRADRRARVAGRRLLVDRDRRRQALDRVDVGLVHLPEELARVGRERLDVAPLALGVERVEGKARLPGPRESGDDDELLARQLDGDVAEVVLPRTSDDDGVPPHFLNASRRPPVEQVFGVVSSRA